MHRHKLPALNDSVMSVIIGSGFSSGFAVPKGFFTQSAMVLLEHPIDVEALAECLKDFDIGSPVERGPDSWMGGAGVVLAMRPEVNGAVIVDLVDRPWPDHLGDVKEDMDLFSAWSMGWFGPFTYPNNLAQAQAMSFSWNEGREVSARHRAFVRIKSSYTLGAVAPDAPVMPPDYAALPELRYVTDVARAVLQAPGALAYFNPNGEVLRSPSGLDEDIAWHRERELLPLPIWTNVRLFKLTDGWSLMDTVGMEQLDVIDNEACFLTNKFSPQEVDAFLRNATNYVFDNGPVIKDGNTMDGPGRLRWVAHSFEDSLAPRPRRVLRWLPDDGSRPPPIATGKTR